VKQLKRHHHRERIHDSRYMKIVHIFDLFLYIELFIKRTYLKRCKIYCFKKKKHSIHWRFL